jgi:hypothetical protein
MNISPDLEKKCIDNHTSVFGQFELSVTYSTKGGAMAVVMSALYDIGESGPACYQRRDAAA